MISINVSKATGKTIDFIQRMQRRSYLSNMDSYGEAGVRALSQATPKDTGESADSWSYKVIRSHKNPGIEWYNDNKDDAGKTPVVILIQYGHATRDGDFVHGRDFINPVMQPVFDKIANDVWKRVTL